MHEPIFFCVSETPFTDIRLYNIHFVSHYVSTSKLNNMYYSQRMLRGKNAYRMWNDEPLVNLVKAKCIVNVHDIGYPKIIHNK